MASGTRGRGGGRGGALGLFQANGAVYTEDPIDDAQEGEVVFEPPSEAERAAAQKQLALLRCQADSPYWVRQAPLRADERELPRYTDRYHPDRQSTAYAASLLEHAPLQKDVFPPNLWASFTSTEAKRVRHAPQSRRPTQIDWDNLTAEEKRTVRGMHPTDVRAMARRRRRRSRTKKIWATTRMRTRTTMRKITLTMAKTTTMATTKMVAMKPHSTRCTLAHASEPCYQPGIQPKDGVMGLRRNDARSGEPERAIVGPEPHGIFCEPRAIKGCDLLQRRLADDAPRYSFVLGQGTLEARVVICPKTLVELIEPHALET